MTNQAFEIRGYDHIKVALKNPKAFEASLEVLGFERVPSGPSHLQSPHSIFQSGEATFCIYEATHPLAKPHFDLHGDTVFDLALWVKSTGDHPNEFIGAGQMKHTIHRERSFEPRKASRGILKFDHNTVNVEKGALEPTVNEYQKRFGFEKGQYFDIKGKETGLYSWVTRAPNYSVQIPFNEPADGKSQIQEYLDIHHGAGVQHIALLTPNIISTMRAVKSDERTNFKFLTIPDTYYELLPKRVKVRENLKDLEELRLLADQDQKGGYLLQIFTENLFGGFFFELIQREGNLGFGEGNFQALFESIELDQKRRGVI